MLTEHTPSTFTPDAPHRTALIFIRNTLFSVMTGHITDDRDRAIVKAFTIAEATLAGFYESAAIEMAQE